MYESFFGLQERPFSISPDPRFFFLSSQHKEALAKCQYAVQERMGLAVIYGDIGTGKTTIAQALGRLPLSPDPRRNQPARGEQRKRAGSVELAVR